MSRHQTDLWLFVTLVTELMIICFRICCGPGAFKTIYKNIISLWARWWFNYPLPHPALIFYQNISEDFVLLNDVHHSDQVSSHGNT